MSQLATITAQKASPLAVMAARFNADPAKLLETLKATVFAAARNNEELQALVIVANSYNLNPLTKEIYAFPAKGGGIVPVVSVDGWANLANSHPQMDGVDFEWEHAGTKLIACTCIVHRKDRSHPIRITEYLEECKRNTDPWKMEHRMLRHKAFCQAVRIAFGFSGIYDEDEAERVAKAQDVTPPSASQSSLFTAIEAPLFDVSEAREVTLSTLHQLLERDRVEESAILRVAQNNGIMESPQETLGNTNQRDREEIFASWDAIVKLIRKEANQ